MIITLTCLIGTGSGQAVAADELSDPGLLIQKANSAMQRMDRKSADFYAARWLAVCSGRSTEAGCEDGLLESFLSKRNLEPKAFLPVDWNKDFLEWFEQSVRRRWGVEPIRIREKHRSFEIAQSVFENKYYATIVAYPQLELWHVADGGQITRPMVMAMGSFKDKPAVYFGRILRGALLPTKPVFFGTQKRTLHYFWKPEFFDVDGDGEPELWLRFNIGWGNGFAQVLEVYRIQKEKDLVLLHRFQGAPDGIARRMPDGSVEVWDSVRSLQDRHRIQLWGWKDKEFKQLDTKEVPYVLKDPSWQEVFTEL